MDTHGNVVHKDINCHYLFEHREELEQAIERCEAVGLEMDPLRSGETQRLKNTNPVLEGTPLSFMAKVGDHLFDTHRLLQSIAGESAKEGAQVYKVGHIGDIAAHRVSGGWHVMLDNGFVITSTVLVLACGAFMPEMLERFLPEHKGSLSATKIAVLVLRGAPIANSMLVTPRAAAGPNIVPFRGADGTGGVSVCLLRRDAPLVSRVVTLFTVGGAGQ
jgi:glycine/D-amino acid oxidase-like deaminating enzyme